MFGNLENQVYHIDGKEIWNSRSCATSLMLFCRQDDKTFVLMNKRGPILNQPFKWCLPCGYMDWNENGFNAARRELWEECGVLIPEVKDKSPWSVDTEPNSNLQNITLHYDYEINGLVETHSRNCEEGEVLEIRWFEVNELLGMDDDLFAFGHNNLVKKRITLW
ncbi:NUDIX hydrolase [bacterium]|nr:NUDIX hydrolase [bacterium]